LKNISILLLFLTGVVFHASAHPQAEPDHPRQDAAETETIEPYIWFYYPGDAASASDMVPSPDTSPAVEPPSKPETEVPEPAPEPETEVSVPEPPPETEAPVPEPPIEPEAEVSLPEPPIEPEAEAPLPEPPVEPEAEVSLPEPPSEPEAEAPSVTASPPPRSKPFVVFNGGVTASWLTRIIKQSGRSNFVFEDFLPGLYFGMELMNLKSLWPKFPLVPQLRLAAYYPWKSTFNDIPQPSKTPLHIAADAILGAGIKWDMLKYVRFSLTPGIHFFFLNSERWNYFNLGGVGILGIELPVTPGWTVLLNGMASFDNGNLGKNREIEPFDIVDQYQVDVGFRYSFKARNEYPWLRPWTPKEMFRRITRSRKK
jgi:hypothetical protein